MPNFYEKVGNFLKIISEKLGWMKYFAFICGILQFHIFWRPRKRGRQKRLFVSVVVGQMEEFC